MARIQIINGIQEGFAPMLFGTSWTQQQQKIIFSKILFE
jgi:hypothetical protein